MSDPTPAGSNPCQDPKQALKTLAQAGLDSLFGAPSETVAAPSGPGVTLRYGTLTKFVPEASARGKSVGDLFEEHAADLGGVDLNDNVTIRDTHAQEGGVVDSAADASVGRTYVASIRKEDKGAL